MEQKLIYKFIAPAMTAAVLLGAAALTPAGAVERGGINLGTTSFFDGFGGLAPGCTYIQYTGHDSFKSLRDQNGDKIKIGGSDPTLDITYVVPQVACTTNTKVLGSSLGWNAVVPFAGHDASPNPPFSTNGFGLGDTVLGAYLAFPPVMSGGRPVFAHGFEFDVITPTGKFDSNKAINPGNHYWSVAPFYKATWLFAPKWELSGRLTYIHNFDHDENGVNFRTGDGVWLNFAASYEIAKDFHLGVNGYWLKQFEADEVAGVKLANSKQESLYIGPGFSYTLDPKNIFNFNVYLPVSDTNAFSDGVQVNLQYVHPF